MMEKQVRERSKSTQQARQPSMSNQMKAGIKVPDLQAKKAPPKVAFGGNAQVPKQQPSTNRPTAKQAAAAASKATVFDKKPTSFESRVGQNKPVVKGGPVVVSYEEDDLGDNRVSKSKARDEIASRIPRASEGKNRLGTKLGNKYDGFQAESIELRGESEYLRIKGNEVDVISGDQLDRLLSQAKNARGVGKR
jgi:hypothetical protein